jgi:oxygen-independent coproporphyrinogen-3 oxidase
MNSCALYVHIPFCKSKCTYCDFFSSIQKYDTKQYIDALIRELHFRLEYFSVSSLKTIYIGGGTPSLLPLEQITSFFTALKKETFIEENAEITFEINPDDVSKELLETLYSVGVTRISMGIQCLDDTTLKNVGRRASTKESITALNLIHDYWQPLGKQLSLDLISGLPYLSDNSFKKGLETVISYKPNHISLYSLTIEENTPLFDAVEKEIIPYSDEENENQWLLGKDILEEQGYQQYEVSNFAIPGYESHHNMEYWKMHNYIGIGSGGTGTFESYRYTNTKKIDSYIAYWISDFERNAIPPNIEEKEVLSKDTRIFETIMMGFRTLNGIDSIEFRTRFGIELETKIQPVFNCWQEKKLAEKTGDTFALNKQGLLFLNKFLREL